MLNKLCFRIDEITARQFPVFQETKLSAGDLYVSNLVGSNAKYCSYSVHLAAAVGAANCPGAPRLEFKFGRPAPKAPAPDLTVPEPTGQYLRSKASDCLS